MATVAQVAKSSLQRILVQASEAELEPDEYQDFIFAMNNFMLSLDADGVTLGYTEVANLGDEVTIPTGALRGLIANMAIEVAPDYNGTISQGLIVAATEGMKSCEKIGQRIPTSFMPSTLSVGSGNESDDEGLTSNFYPSRQAEILAETTVAIGLEQNTTETT